MPTRPQGRAQGKGKRLKRLKRLPRELEADYRELYRNFGEAYLSAKPQKGRGEARLFFWSVVAQARLEAIEHIDCFFHISSKDIARILRGRFSKHFMQRIHFAAMGVPLDPNDSRRAKRERFNLLPGGKR